MVSVISMGSRSYQPVFGWSQHSQMAKKLQEMPSEPPQAKICSNPFAAYPSFARCLSCLKLAWNWQSQTNWVTAQKIRYKCECWQSPNSAFTGLCPKSGENSWAVAKFIWSHQHLSSFGLTCVSQLFLFCWINSEFPLHGKKKSILNLFCAHSSWVKGHSDGNNCIWTSI